MINAAAWAVVLASLLGWIVLHPVVQIMALALLIGGNLWAARRAA